MRRVLITGGAGFIGSNFVRFLRSRRPECTVIVLDKLTYAGNPENLRALEGDPRFRFVRGDIVDSEVVRSLIEPGLDAVFNLAAETHVDRSIAEPHAFLRTDIFGTHTLLEAARGSRVGRFVQISTDEVYGSIERGAFNEDSPLRPSSPYSASKASADCLVRAYHVTYGLPALITRASNNYGPRQYPEKMIPLFITNALDGQPLPLYGDGGHVRDWLHVEDHCEALLCVAERGEPGETYNVGGGEERRNREVAESILGCLERPLTLIHKVTDRPGHDRRYGLDCAKLRGLGWRPRIPFEEGLRRTVDWYRENRPWWEPLKRGAYEAYYRRQYGADLAPAGTRLAQRPARRPARPQPEAGHS
jgi:dTDP-glucose 4,6-dehydratase